MEEQQQPDPEKELLQAAVNRKILVTEEIKAQRQALCDSCDKNKLGFCTECSCIIKAKTWVKIAKCPIGKWDVVDD